MKKPALSLLAIFTLASALTTIDVRAASTYSPGGWSTLHQDAGNRRAVDTDVLSREYASWHALANASILTAPVISPDGKAMYFTTGLPEGNSNLYAYTLTGTPLWHSAPWSGASDGVDPCAILSSPIVDAQGDIYIGDCNQVFAYTAKGEVKWVIDLPPLAEGDWVAAGDHPVNAFTTAAFTTDGKLLGVTNFGDVLIIDRATGRTLNQPYRLPGLLPPYATTVAMPDSVLGDGLMDPAFREWAWQLIFGGSMRSANTPAVARNGRIFVVGSGAQEGQGSLYALDVIRSASALTLKEAFVTSIGLGSGSSPALSPAEDRVYVSDEEGWFYSIDAVSGAIAWKVKTNAAAGAAAVGRDGTIYALQSHAPAVVAIDPDGVILWQSNFSKVLPERLPSSWVFGDPVATGNGNPMVTRDAVLVPVVYGYTIPLLGFTAPVQSVVAALDLKTGEAVRDLVTLPGDSSGITAVLPNGTIISSIGDVLTSAVSPLKPLVDMLLPGDLRMMDSTGGVQVALPVASQ
ncbi:Outer membrane protein assembly factor BamB [Halioglobus japonicus]|nr:Outer membrane protein assembly factor BamB [Halioglobus japonicus]